MGFLFRQLVQLGVWRPGIEQSLIEPAKLHPIPPRRQAKDMWSRFLPAHRILPIETEVSCSN